MLARIRWTLLEAPTSEPWVTTDNPVALFEPFPVRSKSEIYGPSLQFLFPISPRFLLSGDPMTREADDRGRVSVKTVRKMTDELLRIAHRQVYASFFSKDLQGLFTYARPRWSYSTTSRCSITNGVATYHCLKSCIHLCEEPKMLKI